MTVVPAERSTEIVATNDTDSWAVVAPDVYELAKRICDTEFVPEHFRGNPAAITAAVLYGREAGLPPMTTLTQTFVVKGRPGMQAEAMRALVLSQGHEIRVDETTSARCKLSGRRRGSETWTTVTWTLDDARKAGLLPAPAKSGWIHYPRQMLVARATAELCRLVFPDVIHGFRALEELTDEDTGMAPEAEAEKPKRTRVSRAKKKAEPTTPPPEDVAPPAAEVGPVAPEGTAQGQPVEDVPLPPVMTDAASVAMGMDGTRRPDEVDHAAEVVSEIVDAEVVDDDADDYKPAPVRKPLLDRLRSMVMARFTELGITDRGERLYTTGVLVGREVGTNNELTERELASVADSLALARNRRDVEMIVKAQADYRARRPDMFGRQDEANPLEDDQPPLPDMPPEQP